MRRNPACTGLGKMAASERLRHHTRSSVATPDSYVQGTVLYPDSKERLAEILVRAGFAVAIGQWSLRLEGCARAFPLRDVGNITPEALFDVEGDRHDVSAGEVAECGERLADAFGNTA